jgi:hypothetical protein
MITWNDTPGIDGEFMLVVHSKQLFLRSGHNNPNPNYVYWVDQLSEGQYTKLVKFSGCIQGATVSSRPLESMARLHIVHTEESSNQPAAT